MELESDSRNNYPVYKWVILSLLFVATTVNYFDRIVLSVLVKYVKEDLQMDDLQYSYVLMAFQVMYTIGFLGAGKVIDWLGTKFGYLLSILSWSSAATLSGLSGSALSLGFWRGLLGITESGNFPAAIKSVSEWFPARQRSLATSLFNSGPSIALIAGPPLIAVMTDSMKLDWRWTFAIIGAFGFVLVAIWPLLYRRPRHLKDADLHERQPLQKKLRWRDVLKHKETYGIMIGKFCTDPVWWFYIFWLPNYLYDQRGFNIKEIAFAVPLIYIIAIVLGNVAGWAAGHLISRGWPARNARKTVMLACSMCLPISAFAVRVDNPWVAILLVSLACSAHNGWSANIFTLVSDCFPSRAVGSTTGLAGFAGSTGGFLISAYLAGVIVTYFGYVPIFVLMGILHPIAIVFVHLLIKQGKPIEIEV